MKKIYEFDTSQINNLQITNDLYDERKYIADATQLINECQSEVTIFIMGYNRLNKTKDCIESVLKYTKGIDYDLILVDNGSDDGTLEYFKSIDYDKVRIIRINKNQGTGIPSLVLGLEWFSRYYVGLANDIIVTENWLSNLLAVAKSDKRIGMVNPMSSNVSNCQMYNMEFTDFDDMQKKASEYNKSDPSKWHERMRLITLGTLYTKECLLAIGWPCFDCGFSHNFGDDDISFKVRRAGYKTMLAGDTWIHHNHDIFKFEDKNPEEYHASLDTGRKNFQDKYFGVDAWDDVCNHVFHFIEDYITMPADTENIRILGVDVKCGTPVLDIKNSIRKYGIFDTENSAFTQDSKYCIDLRTICNGNVVCDRPEFIYGYFRSDYFDYIIVGNQINNYDQPEKIITFLYSLLKQSGQLFLSLKNTSNIFALLEIMGYNLDYTEPARQCNIDGFVKTIQKSGIKIELINQEMFKANDTIMGYINNITEFANLKSYPKQMISNRLLIKNYWLKITKHQTY